MAKQTVNQGTAPTGVGGDTFRSGSAKLQENDNEIYSYLGDGTNLNKLGTAAFKNVGTSTGNLMEVGAFGIGGNSSSTYLPTQDDFEQHFKNKSGFFFDNAEGSKLIPNYSNFVVSALNDGGFFSIGSSPVGDKLWAFSGGSPGSGYSLSLKYLLHSRNTAIDANGFIKNASPIVQLFADKIELNNEAAEQEIIFEKLGTGEYLIKESSGFAQEGWYIETPKDANGNVLFSVIYTTLENGDISVKTFKKKFDLETASIVADLGNPVDITEGRWIDLRLQELPKPEVIHDPEQ